MLRCDALIVGGGPAGSTCARALRRAGWQVVVADRAQFPRDKVCAGWILPEVFELLDLTPEEYEQAGLTLQAITAFRTGLLGGSTRDTHYGDVVSYAVRRVEFDAFLLSRSGVARVEGTPIVTLRRDDGVWTVNDALQAPVLIGAGGHFCPVARHVRDGHLHEQPVIAKEAEFRRDLSTRHSDVPALYFCRDLDGYGWCVPKGEYLNVGIGHRDHRAFAGEFQRFVAFLEGRDVVPHARSLRWHGHAYLASGAGERPLVGDGFLLVGDAAGLAYPWSGEGIRPAIASGLLAAQTLVAAAGRTDCEALQPYADAIVRAHPRAVHTPACLQSARRTIGRALLSSPSFTKHVMLDRWFLNGRRRRKGAADCWA